MITQTQNFSFIVRFVIVDKCLQRAHLMKLKRKVEDLYANSNVDLVLGLRMQASRLTGNYFKVVFRKCSSN